MYKTGPQNSITLSGEEVPYTFCYLPQMELRFYPENPRIYSVVFTGDEVPTQAEIQERLECWRSGCLTACSLRSLSAVVA